MLASGITKTMPATTLAVAEFCTIVFWHETGGINVTDVSQSISDVKHTPRMAGMVLPHCFSSRQATQVLCCSASAS